MSESKEFDKIKQNAMEGLYKKIDNRKIRKNVFNNENLVQKVFTNTKKSNNNRSLERFQIRERLKEKLKNKNNEEEFCVYLNIEISNF